MQDVALTLGRLPVTWGELGLAAAGFAILLVGILTGLLLRGRREGGIEAAIAEERARETDEALNELLRVQAEMTGRMQTIAEVFGSRQSDFVRLVAERIEGLQQRLGQGLETSTQRQSETLSKLHERLALIDVAQKNLVDLTGEVAGLKEVFSNKQARGAYGQGRMEAIIRDGLPAGTYEFQPTLSNRTRPDCTVRLPGDPRPLVIDAKFPLEAFTAFRAATEEPARARAAARVRHDIGVHVRDIAEKYLIPGETQDLALMFVPAESLYADLQEHFEEVVQRAHRARVIIVSPALLSLAIQVMQGLVRDARIRDEARVIQVEVARLVADVGRLADRVGRLETHFRQAQDDVSAIRACADRVSRRGERIGALEVEAVPAPQADLFRAPAGLRAAE